LSSQLLFDTHRDGVFRYLSRVVGRGDAADLTQEVFLRVVRSGAPEADEHGVRAWVFRIARNLALNHLRDSKRASSAVAIADNARAASQETTAAIHQALERLASLDRDVFLMREAAGLSYEEIAAACEISADAVRSRLHRARQQLRSLLCPPGGVGGEVQVVRLYDKP
jgi:RNA polymerase sigma-70 factor (ECF subfamily)